MLVSEIYIYPIKSTQGISLTHTEVIKTGLKHDRHWAIFDIDGKALTAREFPQLLDVHVSFDSRAISITYQSRTVGTLPLLNKQAKPEPVQVHSYRARGIHIQSLIDNWFTNFLGISCRLLQADLNSKRQVLPKHGGQEDDVVGFCDQAPILILSKASLSDLNSRLKEKIGMERFRPNLIIEGCAPYAEDQWEIVKIGSIQFRIIQQCERCVLTTIDPKTKQKNDQGEPLTTLSQYRRGPKGGVVMGVHAVPIKKGILKRGDEVQTLSTIARKVSSSIIT